MKVVHPNEYEVWEREQVDNIENTLPHDKMHHMEEIECNFFILKFIYFKLLLWKLVWWMKKVII